MQRNEFQLRLIPKPANYSVSYVLMKLKSHYPTSLTTLGVLLLQELFIAIFRGAYLITVNRVILEKTQMDASF